ncbi:MAG: enoyl-CoA hydratase [Rhodospirillaceae bacterium]|nr:enoyl-CoA hydratase [Rhodospirillaceae bacterium]
MTATTATPADTHPAAPNEPVLLPELSDTGVLTLTLNRPQVFNALSEDLLDALKSALEAAAKDSAVRVVVIRAAGRAFCAGHDLKEMRAQPDRAYYSELFDRCSAMMQMIAAMPQPVIAQVHGIAAAAGCQLVAACDLAVAGDSAVFATNGIDNGLFCSTPSVALSRAVARKHAFEMLFTGDFISAGRAAEIGLVNRTAPDNRLDEATRDLADRIAAQSTVTTRSGKNMFYRQLGLELEDAYDFAARNMACDMMSEDAAEGIDAFLEKRAPVWRDR